MRRTAEAAKKPVQPARRDALSRACEDEEWPAEMEPQGSPTHQRVIGCVFRHRIRARAGRFAPSAGNTAAWAASAADHEIVPFSAISAPIGLKMRALAPHVRANAHTHTEDGLRGVHNGSGGQRPSSGRSATLTTDELQRVKRCIFTLQSRRSGGRRSPRAAAAALRVPCRLINTHNVRLAAALPRSGGEISRQNEISQWHQKGDFGARSCTLQQHYTHTCTRST